ncbi:MAG: hypothetical protein WBD22_06970 [Pyrinomonadaceae bacterium]
MPEIVSRVKEKLGTEWIPVIYREKVRSQRTRLYRLDDLYRGSDPIIMHTLLGIELKAGKTRISCPDLATARYLRVFARFGCREFAIPYDITKISAIADQMEVAWHRLMLTIDDETAGKSKRSRGFARSLVIREMRREIEETGAGAVMPEFSKTTKQIAD